VAVPRRPPIWAAVYPDIGDWEIYAERMRYIFNLLRAYRQDPANFDMPGGPEA